MEFGYILQKQACIDTAIAVNVEEGVISFNT
jgi:hypothetical protein